ncbi:MAG: hypothetical protein IPO92_24360 [Saprospiraceae bacterium]|nr:hypothetical protein [Saprospiraceae bacterium]
MDNDKINPAYKIPPYWAAWVIYGNDTPIYEKPAYIRYLLYSLLSAFVIILAYVIAKHKLSQA